jgi:anti-sigma B factor antagonist
MPDMFEVSEATGPRLVLEAVARQETMLIRCKGALNSTNCGLLKTQVKGLLPAARHIVLDLSELSQMDSSGLGTIVGVYISAKNAGCVLDIINLSNRLREIFSLTNLLSLFEPCGRYNMRLP